MGADWLWCTRVRRSVGVSIFVESARVRRVLGTSYGTEEVVCARGVCGGCWGASRGARKPTLLAGEGVRVGVGAVQVCGQQRVFAAVHGLRHDAHPLHFVGFGVGQVEGAHDLRGHFRRQPVRNTDHDDGANTVLEGLINFEGDAAANHHGGELITAGGADVDFLLVTLVGDGVEHGQHIDVLSVSEDEAAESVRVQALPALVDADAFIGVQVTHGFSVCDAVDALAQMTVLVSGWVGPLGATPSVRRARAVG